MSRVKDRDKIQTGGQRSGCLTTGMMTSEAIMDSKALLVSGSKLTG